MKLTIPQYYPGDVTQTDIAPVLLGVSNLQSVDQTWFEFQFINLFNLSLKMPLSTEPVNNFINIMTFDSMGSYDSCSVSIPKVEPNSFMSFTVNQGQVQTFGSVSFIVLPTTPIFPTDQIIIDFSNTSFDLSQIFNYASFTKGTSGEKLLQKTGQTIRI